MHTHNTVKLIASSIHVGSTITPLLVVLPTDRLLHKGLVDAHSIQLDIVLLWQPQAAAAAATGVSLSIGTRSPPMPAHQQFIPHSTQLLNLSLTLPDHPPPASTYRLRPQLSFVPKPRATLTSWINPGGSWPGSKPSLLTTMWCGTAMPASTSVLYTMRLSWIHVWRQYRTTQKAVQAVHAVKAVHTV
jgi:hypothetical protein